VSIPCRNNRTPDYLHHDADGKAYRRPEKYQTSTSFAFVNVSADCLEGETTVSSASEKLTAYLLHLGKRVLNTKCHTKEGLQPLLQYKNYTKPAGMDGGQERQRSFQAMDARWLRILQGSRAWLSQHHST